MYSFGKRGCDRAPCNPHEPISDIGTQSESKLLDFQDTSAATLRHATLLFQLFPLSRPTLMAPNPPDWIHCTGCQSMKRSITFAVHWNHAHRRQLGEYPDEIRALFAPDEDEDIQPSRPASPAIQEREDEIASLLLFDDEPPPEDERETVFRVETFPGAGMSRIERGLTAGEPSERGRKYVHPQESCRQKFEIHYEDNIYYLFANLQQYELADNLTNPHLQSRGMIEKMGVRPSYLAENVAFESIDDFLGRLDIMKECLIPWKEAKLRKKGNKPNPWGTPIYFYKDPLAVLQEILANPVLDGQCVWSPVREFNAAGERVFTDMHMADWWWEMQVLSNVRLRANTRSKSRTAP